MTKKKAETPAVTLEQLESEIAEHGEAAANLTAVRDELLNREQREQLEALLAQQEDAVRGQDGARANLKKAQEKTRQSAERHAKVIEKERAARREKTMAEFRLRQIESQILQLHREMEPDRAEA